MLNKLMLYKNQSIHLPPTVVWLRPILIGMFLFITTQVTSIQAQSAFQFVALGDLPYGEGSKAYPPYRQLIERINQEAPAFSLHVGDFKSGSSVCSDAEFANQSAHFQRFTGAVIYTPGDNDWTDCHRSNNGSFDPLERLSALRRLFFNKTKSLGQQPIDLISQPEQMADFKKYVENQSWQYKSVTFATVHIVGSNNNFESRNPQSATEFFDRNAANNAWIKATFDEALQRQSSAIVISFQADVFESRTLFEDFPDWSGFKSSIAQTLLPLAVKWGKPVLIIHGDSLRIPRHRDR